MEEEDRVIEVGKTVKVVSVEDPEVWHAWAARIGQTGVVRKRTKLTSHVEWMVDFEDGAGFGFYEEDLEVVEPVGLTED